MYNDDFKIRDSVRENSNRWVIFHNLCFNLSQMNYKICYEATFRDNDVGHLSEYLALAFIKFWDGNKESAARMAEGIKMYIDNEKRDKANPESESE